MADLIVTGVSDYATGGIDSATVLISNVSTISARHPNGLAAAIVQIETILGSGTSLKGSMADLVARLAVAMEANGRLVISDSAKLSGVLPMASGGTGTTTFTAGKVLLGNGTSTPLTGFGLVYQGPSSTGAGSTIAHSGTATISGNQALDGIHFYTNFTLNSSVILTLANSSHRLIIVATDTITINGTIDGIGAGSSGGAGGAITTDGVAGSNGYSQVGGGGGGDLDNGGNGGSIYVHGTLVRSGGLGGGPTTSPGAAGVTQSGTGSTFDYFSMRGGGGGGGGSGDNSAGTGGAGGNGGGSVVLIAPTIILGAASAVTVRGANGSNGTLNDGGGGGGGGAGNVFMLCRSYTDNGCTFTLTGGTAGTSPNGGSNGGTGAAGVRQILIYT
jgi:hypothetical protein